MNRGLTMRCSELRALPFSYGVSAVVRPAQSRAVLPAVKPRHSPRLRLAPGCSHAAPSPESLSLESLGDSLRHL